jgi:phosphoglycerate dehydrogenase-like enzyme
VKVVVWLPHEVEAFTATPARMAWLRERCPQHEFVLVDSQLAFLEQLPRVEAALAWRFEAAWYALGPQLCFVATPAAGREKVAPDPTGRVRRVHGHFHGKIMAETLLGMVLHFARGLDVALHNQRLRSYQREPFATTRRLAGQRALIVGYGPLGRHCAALLSAVGMHVTGLKRHPDVDPAPAAAVVGLDRLHEALSLADHVVLTLPGDTGTDHVIASPELRAMRPGACLYNLGRGNAVDEAALLEALETGQLGRAFLDVTHQEPLPHDSPLWTAPGLALLPHASAISREYMDLWFEELAAEQL